MRHKLRMQRRKVKFWPVCCAVLTRTNKGLLAVPTFPAEVGRVYRIESYGDITFVYDITNLLTG